MGGKNGSFDGFRRLLRAGQTAQQALNEFPEDGELIRFQKLAEQAQKKARKPTDCSEKGKLCAGKDHPAGIEKLQQALQLDEKNHVVAQSGGRPSRARPWFGRPGLAGGGTVRR